MKYTYPFLLSFILIVSCSENPAADKKENTASANPSPPSASAPVYEARLALSYSDASVNSIRLNTEKSSFLSKMGKPDSVYTKFEDDEYNRQEALVYGNNTFYFLTDDYTLCGYDLYDNKYSLANQDFAIGNDMESVKPYLNSKAYERLQKEKTVFIPVIYNDTELDAGLTVTIENGKVKKTSYMYLW